LFPSPTKSGPDGATPGSGVAPLAAVFGATCAKVDGIVSCWGTWNYNPTVSIDPIALSGLYGHFCAVSSAGAAYCWREELLGVGEGKAPPIVTVTEGLTANVTAISAGRNQSCAVMAGEAYCWGLNTYGMLGDGSTEERYSPVKVVGLPGRVEQISTGLDSTCATVEGAIYCWGNNDYGQLGNGTTDERLTPVQVPGFGSGARSVTVGYSFACGIVNDRLYCWGRNSSAVLGYTSELDTCLELPCSRLPREVLFP
ncbi:MAG TPA: hypothetical protein VKP30_00795, partial [Polyangiaceae bacterium]|nr:hypothetical protein [Polyangiaceae bacterium]